MHLKNKWLKSCKIHLWLLEIFDILIYILKYKDIFFRGSYWCERRGHYKKKTHEQLHQILWNTFFLKLKCKNKRYKNILLIVTIKQHIELKNIHHMIQRVFFLENVELFYHSIWNVTKNNGHVEEITWRQGNPLVDFRLGVCDSHRQAMVLRAGPSVNDWQMN